MVTYGAPTVTLGAPPVTTACAPASGSSFNVGATTVTCTATDAKQRANSCTFVVTVTPPPKLVVTRFAAFGDSITWGEDGMVPTARSRLRLDQLRPTVRVSRPYPLALQQDLAARYLLQTPTVDNQGFPGELAADPSTFRRFTGLMATGRYDAVLILEGANDLEARDSRVEPSIIAGLRRMIDDAKSRGIRAYLATLPPEQDGCCPNRGISWRQVPELDDMIRALAAEEGVPLVDLYQALIGNMAGNISVDGLHLTEQGYARIAQTFFGTITQTLEQLASAPAVRGRVGPQRPRGGR